jgi:RsiW-degrading membrane proteinase PrsW (M82 family)
MDYLLILFFALAPSLVWMLYFLRKDVHPEDNSQVVKVFVYGALAAFPAAVIQLGASSFLSFLSNPDLKILLALFAGVALSEEGLKYLVVRDKISRSSHLDEPIDLPLYLIISALGFAAAENFLVLLKPGIFAFSVARVATLSFFRFVSATFLHALSSGTLGIFWAAGCFQTKFRNRLWLTGFLLAVVLHWFYNFSIMKLGGEERFLIPFLILINLALVLSIGLKKLKDLKSVCQVK